MDCLPQAQAPTAKPLNPHAQPFKPLTSSSLHEAFQLQQQPQQALFVPVTTRRLFYNHVFTYHPRPVWSFYQAKVEFYDAYSQPLRGNFQPCIVRSVDKDCGHGKEVATDEIKVAAKESSVLDGGNRKTIKGAKRFASPRFRRPGKASTSPTEKQCSRVNADKKGDGGDVLSPASDYEVMLGGNTSLMIKNIPNHFERHDLLRILDNHCREENLQAKLGSDPCRSEYDFLYLPMDFGFRANLGYAFVNFTSADAAMRFCKTFHKHEWLAQVPGQKKKFCEISCAFIQGKDALKNHFEHSKFPCHTNGYLPVVLSPPRDGLNRTRPTLVGKRIDVVAAPPINRRKFLLMMKKKIMINSST